MSVFTVTPKGAAYSFTKKAWNKRKLVESLVAQYPGRGFSIEPGIAMAKFRPFADLRMLMGHEASTDGK